MTLDEAAKWLTFWSPEEWSTSSVLNRFYREWLPSARGTEYRLLPETVKVVVRPGTILTEKETETLIPIPHPMTFTIQAPLDVFLECLHEHGEAMPQGLIPELGKKRFFTDTTIKPSDVRLTADQVESLLSQYDALCRDIQIGRLDPSLDGLSAPTSTQPIFEDIPGKMPNISVAKLAIQAAWQIEKEKNQRATAQDVMALLQEWADKGLEPDCLIRSDKIKRAVVWRKKKDDTEKLYHINACGRALSKWQNSRT